VAVRLRLYKDDLLASCLFFILSLPLKAASDILPQVMPALEVGGCIAIGRWGVRLACYLVNVRGLKLNTRQLPLSLRVLCTQVARKSIA